MKKTYETPVAEKIQFCYEDQIVASGNDGGNNLTCGCQAQNPFNKMGWGGWFCNFRDGEDE